MEIIAKEEAPSDANIMTGGFIITIKNTETDEPIFKARFVIHGNRDNEKGNLVHTSSTVKQSSTRFLIALSSCFGFKIWTQDISQAYLQSASKLIRDIYLQPGKDLEIHGDILFKLLRPLYGLSDSGDYWQTTFSGHIKNDLKMSEALSDYSLFFKRSRDELIGLSGTYVDDIISAGTKQFEKNAEKTSQRFDCKKKVYGSFRFAGIYVKKLMNGHKIHQESYINRFEELRNDCSYATFRSARARLTWIQHTRPEIAAVMNIISQYTDKNFDV